MAQYKLIFKQLIYQCLSLLSFFLFQAHVIFLVGFTIISLVSPFFRAPRCLILQKETKEIKSELID